jgi:O-antigen/teichoic acid export membrane protein
VTDAVSDGEQIATRVARSSAALAAGKMVSMGAGLLLAVLITRKLGAAGLGVYSAAVAFYQVLRSAGEGGARSWLVREAARDPETSSRAVVHLVLMALVRAVVFIPIVIFLIPFLGFSEDLTRAAQIIVIGFLPGVLTPIQEAIFYAYHKTQFVMVGEFLLAATTTVLSIVLLWRGEDVTALVVVFVVLRFLLAIGYFVVIDRWIVRLRAKVSFSYARGLVSEVRAFAASSVLSAAFSRSELLILSIVGTDTQIGYYSAGQKLVEPWSVIPQTVMPNVLPVLSRSYAAEDGKAQRISALAIRYLEAVALPVSVFLVILAEPLVVTLFGEGLRDAVPIVQLLAASVSLQFLNAVLWRVLVARGDEGAMLRAQAITIVPRVAGGLVLVWWLSSIGAAIAAVAVLTLHTGLLLRSVKADGTTLRLAGLTWRFLAAAAMAGVVVLPLVSRLPLIALLAIAGLAYALAVLVLRAVTRDDLVLVRRVVRVGPARSPKAAS